jgi:hypothetical protein
MVLIGWSYEMLSSFFYYYWQYWQAYHKVTFDGPNRLILVNEGVTELNWARDVYSAWKEWFFINSNPENPGYLQAMRLVGGDPLDIEGERFLGLSFFLTNGWRVRTWSGDHRLVISGNVFTDEGEPITIPTEFPASTTIELNTSNLVDLIRANGGTGGDCPDVFQIATAVRNELSAELSRIDVNISSRSSQSSVDDLQSSVNSSFDAVVNLLNVLDSKIALLDDQITTIDLDVSSMMLVLSELKKMNFNRSRIDPIEKTLTIYDDDDITPIVIFNLLDTSGDPSIEEVAEKVPQ